MRPIQIIVWVIIALATTLFVVSAVRSLNNGPSYATSLTRACEMHDGVQRTTQDGSTAICKDGSAQTVEGW